MLHSTILASHLHQATFTPSATLHPRKTKKTTHQFVRNTRQRFLSCRAQPLKLPLLAEFSGTFLTLFGWTLHMIELPSMPPPPPDWFVNMFVFDLTFYSFANTRVYYAESLKKCCFENKEGGKQLMNANISENISTIARRHLGRGHNISIMCKKWQPHAQCVSLAGPRHWGKSKSWNSLLFLLFPILHLFTFSKASKAEVSHTNASHLPCHCHPCIIERSRLSLASWG